MTVMRAPGTPWQQGRGPQRVGDQPRAQMVQGISPRLAQSAAMAGGDMAEAANDLGKQLNAMARRMYEEDMVAELQKRKAGFQEELDALVQRNPDGTGLLDLQGDDTKGMGAKFEEVSQELMDRYLDGVGGQYRTTLKTALHGARSNYKRGVFRHEMAHRDKRLEQNRDAAVKSMTSTLVMASTAHDENYLMDIKNAEIKMAMHNFKGDEGMTALELQRLDKLATLTIYNARIAARPEDALTIWKQIESGESPLWVAENLDSETLISMKAKARSVHLANKGLEYENIAKDHGPQKALEMLEGDSTVGELDRQPIRKRVEAEGQKQEVLRLKFEMKKVEQYQEDAYSFLDAGDYGKAEAVAQGLDGMGKRRDARLVRKTIKSHQAMVSKEQSAELDKRHFSLYWDSIDKIETGKMTQGEVNLLKQALPPDMHQRVEQAYTKTIAVPFKASKDRFKKITGQDWDKDEETMQDFSRFHEFLVNQAERLGKNDEESLSTWAGFWLLDAKGWGTGDFSSSRRSGAEFIPDLDEMPEGWEYGDGFFVPRRPSGVPDGAKFEEVPGHGRGWVWEDGGRMKFMGVEDGR